MNPESQQQLRESIAKRALETLANYQKLKDELDESLARMEAEDLEAICGPARDRQRQRRARAGL